jgi:FlaA1/EpsC-like NDP-sugar epimerase
MLLLRGIALAHDTLMGGTAFFLSIVLRLGSDDIWKRLTEYFAASALFAVIVAAVAFVVGMNRGVWRYASLADMIAILKTASVSMAVFVVAHFLILRLNEIPRSTVIVAWAFTIVLLASPRAVYRLYRDRRDLRRGSVGKRRDAKRVLLVGANDNADVFIRAINERTGSRFQVLAILDERGRRTGRLIRGIPVVGGPEELPALLQSFEARGGRPEAIILTRSRDEYQQHASLERLIEIAAQQRLELLRLPNLLDVQSVDADLQVQPIKLEDLLQRPVIKHDQQDVAAMIRGQKVMITGAGGSIGSELSRQIAALAPDRLILVDASEFVLYSIVNELSRGTPQLPILALLCNVRERNAVRRAIETEKPDIVFHAAALKHVPIVEAQPLEGIFTNTIGTRNVAEACVAAKVKAMILVSTDKAVNPANVMGASKRMAEMFCQAMDIQSTQHGTRFVTVRFGNVLGSAGSVVPLFEKQIKAGGPLTVTHPEIERYFMTIPEACILVLQAAAQGFARRNERGRIFVLDMGTPVKIVDLARNLIRLSGLRPDHDIRIVYTGLRPGEKLYEELFSSRETLDHTGVSGILSAFPRPVDQSMILRIFDEMERLVAGNNGPAALRLLRSTVPDFVPSPTISAEIRGDDLAEELNSESIFRGELRTDEL